MTEAMEMATSEETYGLVREGDEAFAWCRDLIEKHGPLPCRVRAESAGGRCSRPATMEVYGLAFCEDHGQECKAGALEELYIDADIFLEWAIGDAPSDHNPEVLSILRAGMSGLGAKFPSSRDELEALQQAYPLREDLMDEDFRDFDYAGGETLGGMDRHPEEWCRRHRTLIHKLMRLAYAEQAEYIVAELEGHREHIAAQLSYAIQDHERKRGSRRDVQSER